MCTAHPPKSPKDNTDGERSIDLEKNEIRQRQEHPDKTKHDFVDVEEGDICEPDTYRDRTMETFVDSIPVSELKRSSFDEPENFAEVRHLGSGGNGNCYLLRNRDTETLRVCKVTASRPECQGQLPRETCVLQDILPRHDRILTLFYTIAHPWKTQMYFEYCAGGDLDQCIIDYRRLGLVIPEPFIWHCFEQLSEAVAFIHTGYDATKETYVTSPTGNHWTPIIHGDIKPMNIFLRPATNGGYPSLVLGDFGNATTTSGMGALGTPVWLPPETPYHSLASDIWGIGAVVHALCHFGIPPVRRPTDQIISEVETFTHWTSWPEARYKWPTDLTVYTPALDSRLGMSLAWKSVDRPEACDLFFDVRADKIKYHMRQRELQLMADLEQTRTFSRAAPSYQQTSDFDFYSDSHRVDLVNRIMDLVGGHAQELQFPDMEYPPAAKSSEVCLFVSRAQCV